MEQLHSIPYYSYYRQKKREINWYEQVFEMERQPTAIYTHTHTHSHIHTYKYTLEYIISVSFASERFC